METIPEQNEKTQLEQALQELRNLGVPEEDLIGVENLEIGGKGISGVVGNSGWRLRIEDKKGYTLMTSSDVSDIIERKERKDKESGGLSDYERAHRYWDSQLENEVRIEAPQDSQCEFAIVVPVYNEFPERILRQIESLRNQQGVDASCFEVIYVVNNDLPKNLKSKDDIVKNQEVIKTLKEVEGLNIHVIDKSSPGREIVDCNVGKARNRGIAEAGIRFYENSKNGILVQSDADSYFEDPFYLSKIRTTMEENPDCVGIAGGIVFEFDPDTKDSLEREELRKKLDLFVLKQKWDVLVQFLRDPDENILWNETTFSGANMVSRSYESAVIGGVIDANTAEDPQFGQDLEAYAAGRDQKVLGARNSLLVITALRESDRTHASFKKDFDQIDSNETLLVSDPFAETLPDFRKRIKSIAQKASSDPTEMRSLLTNKEGNLIVSEQSFSELTEYIKEHGMIDEEFYRQWVADNFAPGFRFVELLYDLQHPKIPLTEENFARLVQRVLKEPGGQETIKSIDVLMGGAIRFPKSPAV